MSDAPRARKVAERIQQVVAKLLDTRIKDPRLGFVTITEVRVTGDLQNATVFYTVYGSDADRASTAAALESAKGLIRSEVGKAVRLRLTPTLEFVPDALPETAQTLEEAILRAAENDAKIAAQAAGAEYAGDADPYKKRDEEDLEDGTDDYDDLDDEDDLDEYDAYEEDDDEVAESDTVER